MKGFGALATGLMLAAAWLAGSGCGESSPTDEQFDSLTNVASDVQLNVNVQVSQSRVRPGEAVELSATVSAVRAQTVRFSWVNVTSHGRLVGNETGVTSSQFNIRWEAPANLDSGSVQVEVIQLVVTAISQVISVTDKGVQTTHDIASETKTIPITITATQ